MLRDMFSTATGTASCERVSLSNQDEPKLNEKRVDKIGKDEE